MDKRQDFCQGLYMVFPMTAVHGFPYDCCTWLSLWLLYMAFPMTAVHGFPYDCSTWLSLWLQYMAFPMTAVHGFAYDCSTWTSSFYYLILRHWKTSGSLRVESLSSCSSVCMRIMMWTVCVSVCLPQHGPLDWYLWCCSLSLTTSPSYSCKGKVPLVSPYAWKTHFLIFHFCILPPFTFSRFCRHVTLLKKLQCSHTIKSLSRCFWKEKGRLSNLLKI